MPLTASSRETKPTPLLILNSYHPGFTWTENVMEGIKQELRTAPIKIETYTEYMDAKRFGTAAGQSRYRAYLMAKLHGLDFPVIITTDNAALHLALDLRRQMFPQAQIVFCGLNGNPDAILQRARRVTGVVERWDPRGTLRAIDRLQPQVKEIVVLHDYTESGLGTRNDLEAVNSAFAKRFRFRYLPDQPLEMTLRGLETLPDWCAVLLLGYNTDSQGKVIDSGASGPLFAVHARVPVYTMDQTRFSGGVAGGSLLSGKQQGKLAAGMAKRILAGTPADGIPIIREPVAELIFDYQALSRFRLSLPALPPGSRIINRPVSFYEQYRYKIWALSALIIVLLSLVIGLAVNILSRRRMEAERSRLIDILERTTDLVVTADMNHQILYMNKAGRELLGWPAQPDPLTGRSDAQIHPAHIYARLQKEAAGEIIDHSFWSGESAIITADGRTLPVSQVIILHHDPHSGKNYFSSIMRDISGRIKQEQALRDSEENLRITLDSIADAVIVMNSTGDITNMNPAASLLTGWKLEDARGKPLQEILHITPRTTQTRLEDPMEIIVQEAKSQGLLDHPTQLIDRIGNIHMIAESASPIRDGAGNIMGYVLVFRDITEDYALQEKLRHAQRLELMGQLAGGVAHDFNNILAAILGSAQMITLNPGTDTKIHKFADDIVTAALRATDLTTQLLAFSRKNPMQNQPMSVHAIIKEVIRLLERSLDKMIEIEQDLQAGMDIITGDPTLLHSAILNLAVNARDAMPHGGKLIITTKNYTPDAPECEAKELDPGVEKYLEITVSDTGEGIEDDIRERMFEPFFTTKPPGKGTGLGLAAVYGFISSHKGQIEVDSTPGKGSKFKLLLPAAQAKIAGILPAKPADMIKGTGRILLIDDEESIRNTTAQMLETLGYHVQTEEDAHEAVKYYAGHYQEIDLVILDLLMPKISGRDVFYMLRKYNPGAQILIYSGFAQRQVTDELIRDGAAAFIHKPFKIEELSALVSMLISNRT